MHTSRERLLLFQNVSLSSCSSFYITVQALRVFSPNLMWHLKDYSIFRKAQGSDLGGHLAGSDAVMENSCYLQAVVKASYWATVWQQPNSGLCVFLIKHEATLENENKIQRKLYTKVSAVYKGTFFIFKLC